VESISCNRFAWGGREGGGGAMQDEKQTVPLDGVRLP
jgi:hypothetical protein